MLEMFRNLTGRTIENDVPLIEYVGGTATTAVFRSTFSGEAAAVKLFTADPATADAQLSRLQAIEKLSHPNLLRVFKVGRGEIDGVTFHYVVNEFAEENLAQVLPERALSPEETREVLGSTLDALAYLHNQEFVHSDLKPANILARGDQLKLSIDSVRHQGDPLSRPAEAHDAPEANQGVVPASDIWSLGITLVEVLTQKLPARPENPNVGPAIDESVPAPFREIAQHCLLRTPELRWTIGDIRAKLGLTSEAPSFVVAQTAPAPVPPAARRTKSKRPIIFAAAAVVIAAAVLIMSRHSDHPESGSPPPSSATPASQTTTAPSEAPPKVESPPSTSATAPDLAGNIDNAKVAAVPPSSKPVPSAKSEPAENQTMPSASARDAATEDGPVHQVMPEVLPAAQRSIEGKVRVKLTLDVDSSGNVTDCRFVSRGPSKYFAKISEEAARRWKFAPASANSRAWQVEFEFRRSGTNVRSKPQR